MEQEWVAYSFNYPLVCFKLNLHDLNIIFELCINHNFRTYVSHENVKHKLIKLEVLKRFQDF